MLQNQEKRNEFGTKLSSLQNALIESYVHIHALREDKAALETSLVERANDELKVCLCTCVMKA